LRFLPIGYTPLLLHAGFNLGFCINAVFFKSSSLLRLIHLGSLSSDLWLQPEANRFNPDFDFIIKTPSRHGENDLNSNEILGTSREFRPTRHPGKFV